MRTSFLTLFLLFALHCSFAQKNEIGIGLGYTEYTSQETIRYKKNIFEKINKNDFTIPYFWTGYPILKVNHNFVLPTIYYSRLLNKHLKFSVSAQYSAIRGIVYDGMYGNLEDDKVQFIQRNQEIQFGYSYSIFKDKRMNAYFGIGFDLNFYQIKFESQYYNGVETNKDIDGAFIPYFELGFRTKICKHFSFNASASILTDSEILFFRPINRISIDYRF